MPSQFNPFEDRPSRDIRNGLSVAFATALEQHSFIPVQSVAETCRCQYPDPLYQNYIEQRLDRYGNALQTIETIASPSPLATAAVLWDLSLFFEVHEILEPEWIDSRGEIKSLLQALIRAAGVYIYLEAGYPQRAEKIARKALPVLHELHALADDHLNTGRLITALTGTLNLPAPCLSRLDARPQP